MGFLQAVGEDKGDITVLLQPIVHDFTPRWPKYFKTKKKNWFFFSDATMTWTIGRNSEYSKRCPAKYLIYLFLLDAVAPAPSHGEVLHYPEVTSGSCHSYCCLALQICSCNIMTTTVHYLIQKVVLFLPRPPNRVRNLLCNLRSSNYRRVQSMRRGGSIYIPYRQNVYI